MRLEEFESRIQGDLGWRKKELSDLYLLIQKNNNDQVLLKSFLLLLYAHWEGFMKRSSKLYLKYVSDKNIDLHRLQRNFVAIALKKRIKTYNEYFSESSIEEELKLLNSRGILRKKFNLKINDENHKDALIIQTESNLNEGILKIIYGVVGISYKKSLGAKRMVIDKNLLANRNMIAHGDVNNEDKPADFHLSFDDIAKLKETILAIIDSFGQEVSDYAAKELYLRKNKAELGRYEIEREKHLDSTFAGIDKKYGA